MTDVIRAALDEHQRIAPDTDIEWEVAFINREVLAGRIKDLGDKNYVIYHANGPSYFSADKVVYLNPGF